MKFLQDCRQDTCSDLGRIDLARVRQAIDWLVEVRGQPQAFSVRNQMALGRRVQALYDPAWSGSAEKRHEQNGKPVAEGFPLAGTRRSRPQGVSLAIRANPRGYIERKRLWADTFSLGDRVRRRRRVTRTVLAQDPADNAVLACAPEAGADCIVSGNAHPLGLRRFRDVPILRPPEFLDVTAL